MSEMWKNWHKIEAFTQCKTGRVEINFCAFKELTKQSIKIASGSYLTVSCIIENFQLYMHL